VLAYRTVHGLIAIAFLACIGYLWWCALGGRRGRMLRLAITALIIEGVLVITSRGNCPLGPLGERIGDPVPLFELALSPSQARRAVPTLGAITAAGLAVLVGRARGLGRAEFGQGRHS
jgi:hypothetical protein